MVGRSFANIHGNLSVPHRYPHRYPVHINRQLALISHPRDAAPSSHQVGDNYLGSPAVVTALVSGFVQQVYNWMKMRAREEMTSNDFKANVVAESVRLSNIFLGRDKRYQAIVGWNSPYGVGIALKQSLGEFWTRYGAAYDDDPVRAVCGWLVAHLVEAARKSQAYPANADLEGLGMLQRIRQVSDTLLGVNRRAT